MKNWNIESETGYKPMTTLYEDFSIADAFGIEAIKDTYKRAFEFAKDDYKLLTEFVMVLNWKIWEHWEKNKTIAGIYNSMWSAMDRYCTETLKGKELQYFYKTTD